MKHNTIDDLRFLGFVMDEILWLDNLTEPITPLDNADRDRTNWQAVAEEIDARGALLGSLVIAIPSHLCVVL